VRRTIVLLALALAGLAVPAGPASAVVRAEFALGVLTVTGDGDADTIAVGCAAGNVDVNGGLPEGGQVACSAVETIIVRAGDGGDRVNLSDVSRSAYSDLREVGAFGEAGNDTLIGSQTPDRLDGGSGIDILRGGDGADVLVPGGGGDDLTGGSGADRASFRGDGNWLVGEDLVDHFDGDATAIASIERVAITAGPGDDNLIVGTFEGRATLRGGDGDDGLRGGVAGDLLVGGSGHDRLEGSDGNDVLLGKRGNDVIRGGDGNDQLNGGPGDDVCFGALGADSELSC
jgi:Ca2+-binding RTX toxin-like protein